MATTVLLDKREVRIRRMFGHIAPTYDLLNHLLSLNVDRYWRWRTTRLVPPVGTAPILDMCTGTGDLALAYDRAAGGAVPIVGADFCHEMLEPAAAKTKRARADGRISYIEADAQRLPLPNDVFQITTVAFGLRNVTDTARGIAEMVRVISRSSEQAYRYLPESVLEFPDGEALAQRLREQGLVDVCWYPFTFGIATLYVGRKPQA